MGEDELSPSHGAVPSLDADLVRRLVAAQMPRWADLPVRAVALQGWDNRSFRLGDELVVRLPSAAGYEPQVAKEQRWLGHLADHLPLPVPRPVALGGPGEGYPFAWSVLTWLDGDVLASVPDVDHELLARDLGEFLTALRAVPAEGGPPPGAHSQYRGGPLEHWAADARAALPAGEEEALGRVLDEALATTWDAPPVWFHGDVAVGNLLLRDGRLGAAIDLGCAGVGDPACDLVPAWTLFDAPARATFRAAVGLDDATWARGRGWALWKAAITLPQAEHRQLARRTLDAVLEDAGVTPPGRRGRR